MEQTRVRTEELIGLGVAGLLHVALFAALLFQPKKSESFLAEERVTVSLAEDVGLDQVAPEFVDESRAAIAPTLSDEPIPPEAQPDDPAPRNQIAAEDTTRKPAQKPKERTQTRNSRPKPKNTPKPKETQSGGSRLGSDFLGGAGNSADTADTRPPASQIGRQAKASLLNSIARQLRPHWDAPDGAEAEKLSILVSWRLNEDGRLAGTPRCKSVRGVTASNRPQANVYCRYAITAIRRASPFNLPNRYYNAWKSVRDFQFDGEL